jgi:drug/metabolite transporter (DMT)-like permease
VNLVPVSGVTLGILFLGEKPDGSLFIGGILVLVGLLLLNSDQIFKKKK